jgi:3'-phosphoadenosine 5'-phosphosulfate sulfotransferase (PAPS reductase)/FAD synthetase
MFDHALPSLALDATILDALSTGAWVAFSLSGGKDSGAAGYAVTRFLDQIGHPRERRIAIHADLGRAEWDTTSAMVEAVAAYIGVPLTVVRRASGDLVARWEQRFESGKARYEALETYNLIGPWSSSRMRFCTAEQKAQTIGPMLARRFRGETIISVIGIRREESANRRNAHVAQIDIRFAKPGNRYGTRMLTWHPLVDWSTDDVFACHKIGGVPLHEAYSVHGATRLGCRYCVLASLHNLAVSATVPTNFDNYLHLVGMEASSTFSFQPGRWLADVAPHLLPPDLAAAIAQAKQDAAERRKIEAAMPPELRFVKGWPPRMPTNDEAGRIATARTSILRRHGLRNLYPDAAAVRTRFADLIALKDGRSSLRPGHG